MTPFLRGVVVLLRFSINLTGWGSLVLFLGAFKLLLPEGRVRRRLILLLARMGDRWVAGNNRIFDAFLPIEWSIEGVEGLDRNGHYLIFANHVSYADIFVAFRTFHDRTALLRFFAKQEVIWIPFVGQGCWALEFPFMKRYSAEYLARHPEKRGTDLATTRRACERYRTIPVAILNFLEGTRFTKKKQAELASPYRYLLPPRTGGAAFVLASLGDQLDGVLDLTIAYPGHVVSAWDLVTGRVRRVDVRVRRLEIPKTFLSEAITRPGEERAQFKAWIEEVWREKDETLAKLLENPPARAPALH